VLEKSITHGKQCKACKIKTMEATKKDSKRKKKVVKENGEWVKKRSIRKTPPA